ncbi:MAG: exodeoxyribonuclease III [Acidimicrobiaceae bacterium]|nr:exodeoxyribonuclease III [Acidimicrobiaceae bacterium]|tara:strand:- start:3614 stop:4396 length:783 start_codon:yes stop_codon:yes gene_type:complete
MILSTWNVNSIKVRLHAVLQYLREQNPDVLVLQETKCLDENFPTKELMEIGYHSIYCGQKTYNGVAILSKKKLEDVSLNPVKTHEAEMRSIAATYEDIRILNLYVVNGQSVGTPKYKYKIRWFKKLLDYTNIELRKNKNMVIMGDFNIAPNDDDVFDVEATANQVLCSSEERSLLASLLSQGLYDLFLDFNFPPKTFTWWDYRGGAFHRDIGYRIDLILGTKSIRQTCIDYIIDKETRHKSWCLLEPRTSDHAPCRVILK